MMRSLLVVACAIALMVLGFTFLVNGEKESPSSFDTTRNVDVRGAERGDSDDTEASAPALEGSIRVLSAGEPVEEADVWVSSRTGRWFRGLTYATGRATVPADWQEPTEVIAHADGFAPASNFVNWASRKSHDIEVQPGTSTEMQVRSAREIPVAGITVEVKPADEPARRAWLAWRSARHARGTEGQVDELPLPDAPWERTDDSGLVRYPALPRGELTVDLRRGDRILLTQQVQLRQPEQFLEFRLPELRSLHVRVLTEDGRGMKGARLLLLTDNGEPKTVASGQTDSEGSAALNEVPRLPLRVLAGAAGTWVERAVGAEEEQIHIRIAPGEPLRVRGTDTSGNPVTGFTVLGLVEDRPGIPWVEATDTDRDGIARLPLRYPGHILRLSGRAPSEPAGVYRNAPPVRMSSDAGEAVVRFPRIPEAERSGAIVLLLPREFAGPGEELQIRFRGEAAGLETGVPGNGRFRLAPLSPGTVDLTVVAPSSGHSWRNQVTLNPNQTLEVPVTTRKAASLSFGVRDKQNQSRYDWHLDLLENGRPTISLAIGEVSPEEPITLPAIPPGVLRLTLIRNGADLHTQDLTLRPGERRTLGPLLFTPGETTVRVDASHLKNVSQLVIIAEDSVTPLRIGRTPNKKNQAIFQGLPPGQYRAGAKSGKSQIISDKVFDLESATSEVTVTLQPRGD